MLSVNEVSAGLLLACQDPKCDFCSNTTQQELVQQQGETTTAPQKNLPASSRMVKKTKKHLFQDVMGSSKVILSLPVSTSGKFTNTYVVGFFLLV